MIACPICATETTRKRESTPYWACATCGCWFQNPMPSKTWHGSHEAPPEQMNDHDREVNRRLAETLFTKYMQGKPGPTLDIGAALPVLSTYLRDAHQCVAIAIDGETVHPSVMQINFEACAAEYLCPPGPFRLISLVHSFEHLYDPLAALYKLLRIIADDGVLFIRSPDHSVPGFERDLTDGHYQIHPFFHCLDSILEALAQTRTFMVFETYPIQPGQRDFFMRPIL